jgi:hypothetical protein
MRLKYSTSLGSLAPGAALVNERAGILLPKVSRCHKGYRPNSLQFMIYLKSLTSNGIAKTFFTIKLLTGHKRFRISVQVKMCRVVRGEVEEWRVNVPLDDAARHVSETRLKVQLINAETKRARAHRITFFDEKGTSLVHTKDPSDYLSKNAHAIKRLRVHQEFISL